MDNEEENYVGKFALPSYISPHYIGHFYTRGRIIRLDELEQTFVVHLVKCVSGIKKGARV